MGRWLTVTSVECAKVSAQAVARIALALSIAGPFAFAAAMRVQTSVPADTLFGRSVTESGFAIPLVILGFAALWAFPVLTSVVGGDLFSSEDRHGTWSSVLTRSCTRGEIFAGKVITALAFATVAVSVLAASSVAAGVIVVGQRPLVDLSGVLREPAEALTRVVLAWATALPPALGFTAMAVLASIATRSSAAGIGLPVVIGLAMQLCTLLDGPEAIRRLLLTASFGAWHGLLAEPPYYRPLIHGTIVSSAYVAVCLTLAYRLLQRRDIGG